MWNFHFLWTQFFQSFSARQQVSVPCVWVRCASSFVHSYHYYYLIFLFFFCFIYSMLDGQIVDQIICTQLNQCQKLISTMKYMKKYGEKKIVRRCRCVIIVIVIIIICSAYSHHGRHFLIDISNETRKKRSTPHSMGTNGHVANSHKWHNGHCFSAMCFILFCFVSMESRSHAWRKMPIRP